MARLDVVIDHPCVARRCVAALPQILEEDPHEHRTDGHANQCQAVCRIGLASYLGYISSLLGCSCCHHDALGFRYETYNLITTYPSVGETQPSQSRAITIVVHAL